MFFKYLYLWIDDCSEISKTQDRLTDLLQNMYKDHPQYREIVRMIMSTVGRGGEGDVGQRIRDEILVIQVKISYNSKWNKSVYYILISTVIQKREQLFNDSIVVSESSVEFLLL